MADGLKITQSGDGLAKLRGVVSNLKNPRVFLEAVPAVLRKSVGEEYAARAWKMPTGGSKPWPEIGEATRAMLGFKEHPILQESGTLRDAWLGLNAYSLTKVDAKSASIGVQGLPYAAIQRGGGDSSIADKTLIPVTAKMRMFLGKAKGLWLSPDKENIVIPSHPHATGDPGTVAILQGMMLDFSLTGRIRGAGGRFLSTQ